MSRGDDLAAIAKRPSDEPAEEVEAFVCPNCRQRTHVRWKDGETSRQVPCTTCYGEDFVQVVEPRQVAGPAVTADVVVATVKVPRGEILTVVRGQGAETFTRDPATFDRIAR